MRFHSSVCGLVVSILIAVGACAATHAQTDVALSIYGAFSGATNNNNVQESPSNAGGGIVELRHIRNPMIGYEATYSFNRANQVYGPGGLTPVCAPEGPCLPVAPVPISANAHEITGDWVISDPTGKIRPFALAGAGLLLTVPVSGQSGTQNSTTAVYVYGAGIDYRLVPHIGLRLQYRGNVYRAPQLSTAFSSIDAFKHTAEPMIGAYFRF